MNNKAMMTLIIIFLVIPVAILLMLIVLSIMSHYGTAPGIVSGKLASCPATPNCLCSEFVDDDAHFIEPISISTDGPAQAVDTIVNSIKDTIDNMGGEVQTVTDDYIAATFSSRLFRYVDDMEIRIDTEKGRIHIRSASRVGHGDSGANARRVKLFRQLYEKNASKHQASLSSAT